MSMTSNGRALAWLLPLAATIAVGCGASGSAGAPAARPGATHRDQGRPAHSAKASPKSTPPATPKPAFIFTEYGLSLWGRNARASDPKRYMREIHGRLAYVDEPFHVVELVCVPKGLGKASCKNVTSKLPATSCGKGRRRPASARLLRAVSEKPPEYLHEFWEQLAKERPDAIMTRYIINGPVRRRYKKMVGGCTGRDAFMCPKSWNGKFTEQTREMHIGGTRRQTVTSMAQSPVLAPFHRRPAILRLGSKKHEAFESATKALLSGGGRPAAIAKALEDFAAIAKSAQGAIRVAAIVNVATLTAHRAGHGDVGRDAFVVAYEAAQTEVANWPGASPLGEHFTKAVEILAQVKAETDPKAGHLQFAHPNRAACTKDHPLRLMGSPKTLPIQPR